METNKGIEAFYAETRQEWREWLKNNSQIAKSVCLIIYHKKSKTKSITYNDAIEEALCYGWIDSLANKRDDESFYQRFSPRKTTSNWSQLNRERVAKIVEQGLMTEYGQKTIDIAKEKGKWEPIVVEK